jgi:hypothetical protein
MRTKKSHILPVSVIISELTKMNADFDILESFLQECIDREKGIIELTAPITAKEELYSKKTALYEVQILLTGIRNRHLCR